MRIALASVQVPFIKGGAEHHAENLRAELIKRGHEADIITMPFKWYPASCIVDSILFSRMIDLTEVNGQAIDRVIGLKFPMYFVKHPNKVIWALHQHRQAYELWGTKFGDLEHMEDGVKVRDMIINADNKYLRESKAIFTNSKTVSDRMSKYNAISSEPLYHPPSNYEKLYCEDFGDYIFYPSRLHEIKRQHLLIEAMSYTKSNAILLLAGTGEKEYTNYLNSLINKFNLHSKVKLLGRITEEEKISYYAKCLLVYNGPYEEDYGYVTLEGFYSSKPLITHTDSGGPLEFVENEITGYVVEANPESLAEKIDYLFNNKHIAKSMGMKGNQLMKDLKITWDYVIERLLQ
ncbi:glycosyltransferase family 4 protein [Paenibacillus radicis (ex Xue et al. 2023)]|uniref:Glycosyltransferase family 4 protein n=1 Tax=Paenibacillus radicis (ex Xue et al. 2023) TaxID=2972489 RepID=A0ABT1YS21_9BACL|nr:glycosyltransferase family 4 protein [Paenibacillus radicis (ex Xue et al. 2023)]MCR8635978.1 glycosyltransferase family 4 protein [Paenibacillus radicis (ex Xue et al. 2023)]